MSTLIHTVPLGFDNGYLLRGTRSVFIDGGSPGSARTLAQRFRSLGLDPSAIALVVLTHAHWDHIGAVKALLDLSGAKLAVHRHERHVVERGLKSMPPAVTAWGHVFGLILRAMLPFVKIAAAPVDIEIGDEGLSLAPYGIAGRVVFTPGHSRGSVSIVLDSGEAFVGDLAMNGLPLQLGPGLPIFAEDMAAVRESWARLLKLGVKQVFPAHGRPFPASVMAQVLAVR